MKYSVSNKIWTTDPIILHLLLLFLAYGNVKLTTKSYKFFQSVLMVCVNSSAI